MSRMGLVIGAWPDTIVYKRRHEMVRRSLLDTLARNDFAIAIYRQERENLWFGAF
jgi:L-rhamnose mutarotase